MGRTNAPSERSQMPDSSDNHTNCRCPKSLIQNWTKRRIHRRPSERAVFMSLEFLMRGFEARKLHKEIERFLESVFWKHFQFCTGFAEDYHIAVPIGGTRKWKKKNPNTRLTRHVRTKWTPMEKKGKRSPLAIKRCSLAGESPPSCRPTLPKTK